MILTKRNMVLMACLSLWALIELNYNCCFWILYLALAVIISIIATKELILWREGFTSGYFPKGKDSDYNF